MDQDRVDRLDWTVRRELRHDVRQLHSVRHPMGVIGFDVARHFRGSGSRMQGHLVNAPCETNSCQFQAQRLRPRRLSEPEVCQPELVLVSVSGIS